MRIINYKQGYYSPNVAIVVKLDKYSNAQLLVPTGLQSISGEQWNAYWSAVQANAQIAMDADKLTDYKLYTVDLLAYKNLYIRVDHKVYKVFAGYETILEHMLAYTMHNALTSTGVSLSMLTGNSGELVQPELSFAQNVRLYCSGSGAVSSRLINIAVPTYDEPEFFYELDDYSTKRDDDTMVDTVQQLSIITYNKTTYDTSDYSFVQTAIGQSFKLRKRANLQLSVSIESFGQTKTVIALGGVNQLNELQDILDIVEEDAWLTIQFMYNANRTYKMTCNTSIVAIPAIPANSIKIATSDMLAHAKACNAVVDNVYIQSLTKQYTYELPETTVAVRTKQMTIQNWFTASTYAYNRFSNGLPIASFNSKNLDCWHCASYKLQPLQTGESRVFDMMANVSKLSTMYGNAEYCYIVNLDADVTIPDAFSLQYNMQENDDISVETQANINFQYKDLPYILDNKVDFNNVRYVFNSSQYNGKQFASVIIATSQQSMHKKIAFIETTIYVVLLVHMFIPETSVALPDYWYNSHSFDALPALAFANNAYCSIEVLPTDYTIDLPVA